ncbi:hypothetical protein HRbin36_02150 [bacterium HR36]|nr:hypothetical protein HRbin36_02150 [bacterium HR36]
MTVLPTSAASNITTWALITAEGDRRLLAITPTTDAPVVPGNTDFPRSVAIAPPARASLSEVASSGSYGDFSHTAPPGWQLFDRLLAETRWFFFRHHLRKRGVPQTRRLRAGR